MSAKNIIQYMKAMISLHDSLNKLALEKTELVKKGDVSSLQALMKDENKLIIQVRKAESLLTEEAKLFLKNCGENEKEPVLSTVIDYVKEDEKAELIKERERLMEQLTKLKKQNDLNQELLDQSLQFVQLSLDLLQPDIDAYNYDRNEAAPQENKLPSRSLFDSKA